MNCHIHTLQNRFTFRHVIPLLLLFVFYGAASQGETTFVVQIETHPFQGVRYLRCEKAAPDPQVAHLIEIELDAPGIRFTTTGTNGTDAPRETWCETTLEFVKKTGAQIGINGNYFIYDNERHTELIGLAVSDGEIVSPWDTSTSRFALHISKENKAALIERPNTSADTIPPQPKVNLYNAVGGRPLLLRDGTVTVQKAGKRHPRTGVGITADNKLLLLIVDGRQPSYSVGMTFYEMAMLLLSHGAVNALALDGGGSTTLVLADPSPRVVNVPMPTVLPIDVGLKPPGIERMNGNNLALFALPLPSAEKE